MHLWVGPKSPYLYFRDEIVFQKWIQDFLKWAFTPWLSKTPSDNLSISTCFFLGEREAIAGKNVTFQMYSATFSKCIVYVNSMLQLFAGFVGQQRLIWISVSQVTTPENICSFFLRARTHDQILVAQIILNKIVTLLTINVPSCQINVPPCDINDPTSQINVPPSQINVPHCQINVPLSKKFPSLWDRIMTLGTFICKMIIYLCPF